VGKATATNVTKNIRVTRVYFQHKI
jgi:hypothetical protein